MIGDYEVSGFRFRFSAGQKFTTGDAENGYTLSAVDVPGNTFHIDSSPRVSIYTADPSGAPGSSVFVLGNPISLTAGATNNTFSAPANATLAKETDYFVVFEETATSSASYLLNVASAGDEDSGAATGWSIADDRYERASDSGDWSLNTVGYAVRIAIKGSATASDAPSNLEATPGDESVTLRWTASAHDGGSAVTSHQYRQKTTGEFGDWQEIPLSAAGGANAGSFTVSSGLTNGTTYTFQVQAVNMEGGSGPSNEAIATPVAGDTTAPMLQGATTTALELKLFYDENLDAGSEPAPTAFTVTVNDATRAVTGVSASSTNVFLTLASAVRAGETVTVSYTVPAMNPLRDEASNPAAPFAGHPVTNETPATAPDAPTSLEATPGDESVTLRWNAPAYDGGSDITSHQYRRKTTGSYGDWQNIPMSAPGGANAGSFTVSSGLTNGTTYTFQVQAVNMEGGSAESNEARATPVAGDTTAPMLQGATTTALELKLTYDENLDAGSEPAPTAFTVTVNDATRAVTGVSASSTNVFLTLASAVRAGEPVTVSYTVPAMNPLRDEASNPAAPFAGHPVTNETPATAPDAPTSLEATPGDGSVTLRWTASAYDGGSEVTSHQYRHKTTGSYGDWQNIPMSAPGGANAGSFTVSSGLTNGTTYTFQVQAVNMEGGSAESNEARATPVAGDTTAPMLQGATTTALELKLTYDENLDAGSEPAPTAFTVTVNDATRAVTGVSASSTNVFLDPRLGGSGRGDGDGVVRHARDEPAPGRGEQPRRPLCRPPGDEHRPGDGAGRADGPRGDPRRRVGDASLECARVRRRKRHHLAPVPAEDDGFVRGLAEHPDKRGGRDERRQLHRIVGADQRHDLHLPGTGGESWREGAPSPTRRARPRSPATPPRRCSRARRRPQWSSS